MMVLLMPSAAIAPATLTPAVAAREPRADLHCSEVDGGSHPEPGAGDGSIDWDHDLVEANRASSGSDKRRGRRLLSAEMRITSQRFEFKRDLIHFKH